jgi:hypothetical protein
MTTVIKTVVPTELEIQQQESASDMIVSRRLHEFLPESLSSYSFASNRYMRFLLNSADSFIDGPQSYLRGKLTTTLTNATATLQVRLREQAFFDVGGIHSAIRALRIRLNSGVVLDEINHYNKFYAQMRRYMMSKDHLDAFESCGSLDSVEEYKVQESALRPLTYTDLVFTAATGVLTLTGGNAVNEISVGDVIVLQAAIVGASDRIDSHHVVLSVASATSIVLTSGGALNTAGANHNAYLIKNSDAPRNSAATTQSTEIVFNMRALSGLLQLEKYLPLMFMKNLEIEFELEDPNLCMVSGCSGAAMVQSYTIADPRYVASLVQPSEALRKHFLDMYNGPGIPLHFIGFQHNQKSLSAASVQNVNIPCRVRSARSIITARYYPNSDEVNATYTPNYKSISNAVKCGTTYYEFRIGSQRYPEYGRSNVAGLTSGENMALSRQALGIHDGIEAGASLSRDDYFARQNIGDVDSAGVDVTGDSRAFLVAVRCDKYSDYSGIDIQNNDLNLEFDCNNATALYLHSWIAHDKLLKVSSDGTVVSF